MAEPTEYPKGEGIAGQVVDSDPQRNLAVVQVKALPESVQALSLGQTPGPGDAKLNAFFVPFGPKFHYAFCGDPGKLKAVRKELRYSEFEAPLEGKDLAYYQQFRSVNPKNQVHL